MFRFEFQFRVEDERIQNEIWRFLCEYDTEFFPRLAARESSVESSLKTAKTVSVYPQSYFDEIIKQSFILAFDDDNFIGFIAFKYDYVSALLKDFGKCHYITTIIVRKDYRNKGVMRGMYNELENVVKMSSNCRIATRTWSDNLAHIHVLESMGYMRLLVLPEDRGKGVATIYFGKDFNLDDEGFVD